MVLKTVMRSELESEEKPGGCCGGGQHTKPQAIAESDKDSSDTDKHEKAGCCCGGHH